MISFTSLFKNIHNGLVSSLRTFAVKPLEPIQYPGFKYYPRHENFKDPPCEPSKLFLVFRRKPMRGRTAMEVKCLRNLNLDGKKSHNGHIAILKNIPEINAVLWKIKHIVEIKPITWKGELPKDGDYTGTYLRETGEFLISPKLKVPSEEVSAKYNRNQDWPRYHYLRKHLKAKKQNPMVIAV